MGEALAALHRRQKIIHNIKVTCVWVGLVALLTAGLLLLRIQPSYMLQHYNIILQGAGATIGVSLASITIATILALFGAVARLSSNSIAQGVSGFYVSVIRGTPLLIQIFLIYLGLPQIGSQLIDPGISAPGKAFHSGRHTGRHPGAEPQLWCVHDRDLSGRSAIHRLRPARSRPGHRHDARGR